MSGVGLACDGAKRVDFRDLLEFAEIILLMGRQPTNDPAVGEELGDVSARHGQVQIVDAIGFIDRFDLRLQRRQLSLHPGNLLPGRGLDSRARPFLAVTS